MNERTEDLENTGSVDGASRREFLKTAGAAAAALAASTASRRVAAKAKSAKYSVAPPRVIGANDRINIGHIGLGGQGTAHLNTLKGHAQESNIQSVAVCDVYQSRLEGSHKAIGSPPGKAY